MIKNFNKLFCIGLNKAGTTSLYYAFGKLGFKALHNAPNKRAGAKEYDKAARILNASIRSAKKNGKQLLTGYEDYDAYLDIDSVNRNFEILDNQCPNSKFIFTDRDVGDWIDSRVKHVIRNRKYKEKGLYNGTFLEIKPAEWAKERKSYLNHVTTYFKGREEDLLIMNVASGDGWEKLCPFLGLPVRTDPFPWQNKTNMFNKIKSWVTLYFRFVVDSRSDNGEV